MSLLKRSTLRNCALAFIFTCMLTATNFKLFAIERPELFFAIAFFTFFGIFFKSFFNLLRNGSSKEVTWGLLVSIDSLVLFESILVGLEYASRNQLAISHLCFILVLISFIGEIIIYGLAEKWLRESNRM